MKYLMYIVLLSLIAIGAVLLIRERKPDAAIVVETPATDEKSNVIELCFAKIQKPEASAFEDKYTLRLFLKGDKATGELKFLPTEKDSKGGPFSGIVTPVDTVLLARTAYLSWMPIQKACAHPKSSAFSLVRVRHL